MQNPGLEELQNSEKFELVAELQHDTIKEFVLEQISKGGRLVKYFMIYQVLMILLGFILISYSVFSAFYSDTLALRFIVLSAIFSFSLLIVLHELLHGLAIKLVGAPRVNYGFYIKRFIFYAEADRFVMNKKQFTIVALAPFIVVKALTILGVVLFIHETLLYSFLFVMAAHSMFCAGDIALLSMFYRSDEEIYTFDVKSEKRSYYYRRKS